MSNTQNLYEYSQIARNLSALFQAMPEPVQAAARDNLAYSGVRVEDWGVDFFKDPQHPDPVVRSKGIRFFQEMVRSEPVIKGALFFKKFAVVCAGCDVQIPKGADEPTAKAQEIRAFVDDNLNSLQSPLIDIQMSLLNALRDGFSVHEKILKIVGNEVRLVGIKAKPSSTFDFDTDNFGNLKPDGLIQFQDQREEQRLPVNKFVIWPHFGYDNWYGESDLRSCIDDYNGKRFLKKMWAYFIEKAGKGVLTGKVPPGTSEEQRELFKRHLQAFQIETVLITDIGNEIGYIEANAENFDTFEKAIRYHDSMLNRGVLMPDLMLGEGLRVGSKALGQQHGESFIWMIRYYALMLSWVITMQIIKPLVDANYDMIDGTPYPEFIIKEISPEDQTKLIEIYERATNMGVRIDEGHIREQFEIPEPEEDNPLGGRPSIQTQTNPEPESGEEQQQFQERTPSPLESKIRTSQIERLFNRVESTGSAKLQEVLRDQRRQLLGQLQNQTPIESLTLPTDDFQRVVEGILQVSYLYGNWHGLQEVRRMVRNIEPEQSSPASGLLFAAEDLEGIDPTDAIAFFQGKIPIPQEQFDRYTRQSFTIANITSQAILNQAKLIIEKGLTRGASRQNLIQSLVGLFDGYIQTGEVRDETLLQAHRVENIVRTNLNEAYNSGRLNMFRDANVREVVPAVLYSAIIDSRTTQFCRRWDGTVLRLDDPRLDEVTPPNHFQCRSLLVPVTSVEEFEITEQLPQERPQRGFLL